MAEIQLVVNKAPASIPVEERILGFTAKLKIIDRWNKLDPETGRELFRKLVDEIRKTR